MMPNKLLPVHRLLLYLHLTHNSLLGVAGTVMLTQFSILTIVSAAGITSQEAPAFGNLASSLALLWTVLSVASLLQVRIQLCQFSRVY
jgi:hypothetical protein